MPSLQMYRFILMEFFSYPLFHFIIGVSLLYYIISTYASPFTCAYLDNNPNIAQSVTDNPLLIYLISSFSATFVFGDNLERKKVIFFHASPLSKNKIFFILLIGGLTISYLTGIVLYVLALLFLHPQIFVISIISIKFLTFVISLLLFLTMPYMIGVIISIISKRSSISFFVSFIASLLIYGNIAYTYKLMMPYYTTNIMVQIKTLYDIFLFYRDALIGSILLVVVSYIIWMRWCDV